MCSVLSKVAWVYVCVLALLLSGGLTGVLADTAETEDALAQQLQQRVRDRWQAMIAHDFEQVYQFHTPAYRALYSYEAVGERYAPSRWLKAEVVDLDLSSEANDDVAKGGSGQKSVTQKSVTVSQESADQSSSAVQQKKDMEDANDMEMQDVHATVTVLLEFEVPFPSPTEPTRADNQVEEVWLYTAGEWWFVK